MFKQGILYDTAKNDMRPFDAIFFKGNSLFSRVISCSERLYNNDPNSGEFTHVGMIVTSDILNHPNVLPGKLYILESTIGGHFGLGVYDISGRSIVGVQLRDLDDVVNAYDAPINTAVAHGKLTSNPIDKFPLPKVKEMFTEFFNNVYGKLYNGRIYDMLAAFIPYMRGYREFRHYINSKICICSNGGERYFCSELIALAYVNMGVYPKSIDTRNVMPRDIATPWNDTDVMPTIINNVIHVVTQQHYNYGAI